jgi:hypothetical protein
MFWRRAKSFASARNGTPIPEMSSPYTIRFTEWSVSTHVCMYEYMCICRYVYLCNSLCSAHLFIVFCDLQIFQKLIEEINEATALRGCIQENPRSFNWLKCQNNPSRQPAFIVL